MTLTGSSADLYLGEQRLHDLATYTTCQVRKESICHMKLQTNSGRIEANAAVHSPNSSKSISQHHALSPVVWERRFRARVTP